MLFYPVVWEVPLTLEDTLPGGSHLINVFLSSLNFGRYDFVGCESFVYRVLPS